MDDISTTAGETESASQAVLDHPAVRAVTADLAAIGLTPEITTFAIAARTAPIAAEALGIEVAQIANSLIFCADDAPLLVMISGAHRVDTANRAQILDYGPITPATAQYRTRAHSPDHRRRRTGRPPRPDQNNHRYLTRALRCRLGRSWSSEYGLSHHVRAIITYDARHCSRCRLARN